MILAAIIALAVLLLLTAFQLALIAGAPLGNYAWGGQHKILPLKLRVGSATSIIIYVILAVFALSKSGLWVLIQDRAILHWGLWIMTIYLGLGVFLNAISRSKRERLLMTPTAFVLALAFLVIAAS